MEGKRYGLGDEDMLFTSDIGYPQGFPRQGIFELFTLSNLFICPSYSESFGLTVLEAGSPGKFSGSQRSGTRPQGTGGSAGGLSDALGCQEFRL